MPHTPAATELVQLLTPTGERVTHPDYPLDISTDEIKSLYRDLVMVRRFDAEATALQRQGELGLWAQSLGQEAAQVGSGRALERGDYAFPTYREHGVAWAKGVPPKQLLGLYRGIDNGGWDARVNEFHSYTLVIGSQTLHATGYAMGLARDAKKSGERCGAVIAYFGDGATSQGDVNEAFVYASVFHAPVVFFCQNNQWAISSPIESQTKVPLYQRAWGFGFDGIRVDGNDVLACLAVTRKALANARDGEGPTFVEAFTYRMGAHTTSDDPSRYRLAKELTEWQEKDPIARVKTYLEKNSLADENFFREVEEQADQMATSLRFDIINAEDPVVESMFENVYAEPHFTLNQERDVYLNYLDSFEDGGA